MKELLVVFHSQSGNTLRLAEAVALGAQLEEGVQVRVLRVQDAGMAELAAADGILIGAPENFGALSGAAKDFFDRCFYPAIDRGLRLPYGLFISAGNDGSGAIRQLNTILKGIPFKAVAEPVLCLGETNAMVTRRCRDLGQAMAAGLVMGIY